MKSFKFAGHNCVLAEDQEDYESLYIFKHRNNISVPYSMCFELTDNELAQLYETSGITVTQLTFNEDLQPVTIGLMGLEACASAGGVAFGERIDRTNPVTWIFNLDKKQLKEIFRTKKLWVNQYTAGKVFLPISVNIKN
jgi:hypothetical protein